jgi:hypothetical protein
MIYCPGVEAGTMLVIAGAFAVIARAKPLWTALILKENLSFRLILLDSS